MGLVQVICTSATVQCTLHVYDYCMYLMYFTPTSTVIKVVHLYNACIILLYFEQNCEHDVGCTAPVIPYCTLI